MNRETVFTNARIVLNDEIINGSICVQDGDIKAISESPSSASNAIDLDGDFLMPGLVELHTDNLEKHFTPRPGVKWPEVPAIFAHDAMVATAGITTVFNAVATGDVMENSARIERFHHMVEGVRHANDSKMARAEHLLHIRCELTYELTLENFKNLVDDPLVKLVSVMDHSPGQRQFANIDKYKEYYQGKYHMNESQIQALIERQTANSERIGSKHRKEIAQLCRERGLSLASHDDATSAHVAEAVEDGIVIAEFPTTVEAAEESRKHGLHVLMGSPNAVRGLSHSGNVSARDLAAKGLLDTLSSDYVPNSLLHSAFVLEEVVDHISLPQAIRMVSTNPADAAGLDDRGEIALGKRADLIKVKKLEKAPLVRQVWRQGIRVI
ncbi:MAG: alpha-D-ribose 1-methylphosphonate 5-triphosphate diphosphatase [Neptuniibacter sp.]